MKFTFKVKSSLNKFLIIMEGFDAIFLKTIFLLERRTF